MSDDMATTIEREAAQRPGRPSPVAPEQPEPAKSGGNKRTIFIIMGVVLLGLVAVGIRRWIYSLSHVSTDNAQVDGHIIPIHLGVVGRHVRSEEHTSELQSHSDLVCRLLLEKKNKKTTPHQKIKTENQNDQHCT